MYNRRKFIHGISSAAGGYMMHRYHSFWSKDHHPVHAVRPFQQIAGKHSELVVLNDRPLNMETPAHLLDPSITPADVFFVRNNGLPQERSEIRISQWTLQIDGESAIKPGQYTIDDLKRKFETVDLQLTVECGGNGRNEFSPPATGNQWTTGAVGAPLFTGVRLRDVLEDIGVKDDAVYIGYYGSDRHLSGDSTKNTISRGVPIEKAMEAESLIAWNMNGEPLPYHNGYPLRLVIGGWPGSCSGKWLQRLVIRNKVHDGSKMTGMSYRVPCTPVSPGTSVDPADMCIIESMPVKSIITYPKTGAMISSGESLDIRGHAWAGDHSVSQVHWSTDFGATWTPCQVSPPRNRLAWQRFEASIPFTTSGYKEVWARATDSNGMSQPMVVPGWNPRGYLNNACHRIAVKVI